MSTDSDVQGAVEGLGPHVRTIAFGRPQGPDTSGNAQADETVHQQAVTLADDRGDLIADPSGDILAALHLIHEELVLLRLQLS